MMLAAAGIIRYNCMKTDDICANILHPLDYQIVSIFGVNLCWLAKYSQFSTVHDTLCSLLVNFSGQADGSSILFLLLM